MTYICFLATASYGSPMADEVQFLRRYRDNILKRNRIGELALSLFERFYYSFSPRLARLISGRKTLRYLSRFFVADPIVNIFLLLSYVSSRGRRLLAGRNVAPGIVLRGIGGTTYSISWLLWNAFLIASILDIRWLSIALQMWIPMMSGLASMHVGAWVQQRIDFEQISSL